MLKFSVVIPTHNRLDYLEECLNSVTKQLYKPFDVIVVDDLPNDKTEDFVNAYSDRLNITYAKNMFNKGALGSRNLGSQIAKGDIVAFLDDDDLWKEDYLEKLENIYSSKNVDVVLAKYEIFEKDGTIVADKVAPKEFNIKDYIVKNPGCICSNFSIKLDSYYKLNGYDLYMSGSADKDLFLRAKKLGMSHDILETSHILWRTGHGDQWSANHRRLIAQIIKFYFRYFANISPVTHLKMMKKIARVFYYSLRY